MKLCILIYAVAILPCTLAQGGYSNETIAIIASLPQCAFTCLLSVVANSTCSISDIPCLCTNKPLTADLRACVTAACTVKQTLFVGNATQRSLCGGEFRDKRALLNQIIVGATACSSSAVVLRLVSRYLGDQPFWYDDWLLVVTLSISAPVTYVYYKGLAGNGLGLDLWTIPFKKITDLLHVFWFSQLVYFALVGILKTAFLFFYLRIFPSKSFRRAVWITIAFNIVFSFCFFFICLFQCRPINHAWKNWHGEQAGKCLDINIMAWTNAIISIALDIWMIALPISQLRKLQLKPAKKLRVGAMLGVGTFVTIISIVRLRWLVKLKDSSNFSWDYFGLLILSMIELNVSVICACLPQIRQLIARISNTSLMTSIGSSKYWKSSGNESTATDSTVSKGTRNVEDQSRDLRPKTADAHVAERPSSSSIALVLMNTDGERLQSLRYGQEVKQKTFV